MSRFLMMVMAVLAFSFGGVMLGCEEKKEAGPMEELGKQADEAAAEATEKVEEAAEAASDAVEEK